MCRDVDSLQYLTLSDADDILIGGYSSGKIFVWVLLEGNLNALLTEDEGHTKEEVVNEKEVVETSEDGDIIGIEIGERQEKTTKLMNGSVNGSEISVDGDVDSKMEQDDASSEVDDNITSVSIGGDNPASIGFNSVFIGGIDEDLVSLPDEGSITNKGESKVGEGVKKQKQSNPRGKKKVGGSKVPGDGLVKAPMLLVYQWQAHNSAIISGELYQIMMMIVLLER